VRAYGVTVARGASSSTTLCVIGISSSSRSSSTMPVSSQLDLLRDETVREIARK